MDRRKPEQIVQLLHKVDGELAKGKAFEEICQDEQISPATYYRWKQKYGGLGMEDVKRLKALEIENTRLKRWWRLPSCLRKSSRCWHLSFNSEERQPSSAQTIATSL